MGAARDDPETRASDATLRAAEDADDEQAKSVRFEVHGRSRSRRRGVRGDP
jgi:hypothetical protein